MGRVFRMYKTFRLLHVDLSGKIVVEVGCADIKLAHLHPQDSSDGKEYSNRVMFYDGAESFVVVYAVYLAVAFCYKTSFIFVNGSSRCVLDAVDPFTLNDVSTRRRWNEDPSMIFH